MGGARVSTVAATSTSPMARVPVIREWATSITFAPAAPTAVSRAASEPGRSGTVTRSER